MHTQPYYVTTLLN